MEWLDSNHIKGEMSDSDFLNKIIDEARIRDQKRYGRDGSFVVYRESFKYKGFPYFIKIRRYFQIGVKLDKIKGMNHLGKWAVLEYSPELKPISDLISTLPYTLRNDEWMWGASLHVHNDGQTLQQMVEEMHNQARRDIDELSELNKKLDNLIIDVKKDLEKISILSSQLASKKETET